MKRRTSTWALVGILTASCGGGLCDASEIERALATAQPGDTVRVGACRVEGTFRVPAGVTLAGEGARATLIVADAPGDVVVRLEPGSEVPATLRGIAVEGTFAGGIFARGHGAIAIEDVEVRARTGIGIGAIDVSTVRISGVRITGPVPLGGGERTEPIFVRVAAVEPEMVTPAEPGHCGTTPPSCTPNDRRELPCDGCGTVRQFCNSCGRWVSVLATQGLALERVGVATLENVHIEGLAEAGVVLRDTGTVTWRGGTIDSNLGLGAWAHGGVIALEGVTVSRTGRAFRPSGSHAAFFVADEAGSGSLTTTDLRIEHSAGYGIAHVGVAAEHVGLIASNNHDAAVWFGRVPRATIRDAQIENNGFAGIVVVEAEALTIANTTVRSTVERRNLVGDGTLQDIILGDGIHLFGTFRNTSLRDLVIENNERIGLVVDLFGASDGADLCAGGAGLCFENVTVSGTGTQLGALAGSWRSMAAGRPDVYELQAIGSGTWDRGITRLGSALGDAAFSGVIEITGVIAPIDTPRPEGVIAPID